MPPLNNDEAKDIVVGDLLIRAENLLKGFFSEDEPQASHRHESKSEMQYLKTEVNADATPQQIKSALNKMRVANVAQAIKFLEESRIQEHINEDVWSVKTEVDAVGGKLHYEWSVYDDERTAGFYLQIVRTHRDNPALESDSCIVNSPYKKSFDLIPSEPGIYDHQVRLYNPHDAGYYETREFSTLFYDQRELERLLSELDQIPLIQSRHSSVPVSSAHSSREGDKVMQGTLNDLRDIETRNKSTLRIESAHQEGLITEEEKEELLQKLNARMLKSNEGY